MKRPVIAAISLAIAFAAGAFTISALHRADSTPPWRQTAPEKTVSVADVSAPEKLTEGESPFRFIAYNVKNWLVSSQSPKKSDESKQAIIRILAEAEPDVIGLCEIGRQSDVDEIRDMLKAAGLDLPFSHYTGGVDAVRHLAILSKFPIVETATPELDIPGKEYAMQRGILDATMEIGDRKVRFIGLHLKSKRNVPEFDQALVRIDEATHVRKHIDGILAENPEAELVVYGDWNDTTRSLSTRALLGTYRTPGYLSAMHVKDSRGDSWTHCWRTEDIYTRIDFVTVSKALLRGVDKPKSRILDDDDWEKASDHRAVLIQFK